MKTQEKEKVMQGYEGLKIAQAGLIQGVPAFKLNDGTVVFITDIVKDGQYILKG